MPLYCRPVDAGAQSDKGVVDVHVPSSQIQKAWVVLSLKEYFGNFIQKMKIAPPNLKSFISPWDLYL